MRKDFINLTGKKFGRLTVIRREEKNKWGQYKWLCSCCCGNEISVVSGSLRSGRSKSCGCLRREFPNYKIHGLSSTLEFNVWWNMKQRCLNKNNSVYKNYGGRGITICRRWLKFENFFADMGTRQKGLQLDRINNNGNYCPENCKWLTSKENNRNRRDNKMITYKGKTKCLAEWVDKLKIDYNKTYQRICRDNWSIERAFNN